jgi:hypothetical protein
LVGVRGHCATGYNGEVRITAWASALLLEIVRLGVLPNGGIVLPWDTESDIVDPMFRAWLRMFGYDLK